MSDARPLIRRLLSYRPGALATGTLLATGLQLLRVGCQAVTVILLARVLGPQEFGLLVGITGLAMIVGTLSWLGGSYLMLETVTREPAAFGSAWSATRHSVAWSAGVLLLLFLAFAAPLLQVSAALSLLLALGLAEILCYPLVYASGFAFQAHQRQGWANSLPALMAVARLLAALLFMACMPRPALADYALFHLAASLLCAGLALLVVQRQLRPGAARARYGLPDLRRGMGYLAGGLSLNAYGEADKILAVRALGTGPAAAYAIAYRVVTMLVMPAAALVQVAQPRMFRHAQAGERTELARLLGRIALAGLGYTALATVVAWLAAPLLLPLLGSAYAAAVGAARILVLLLPLMFLRLLAVTVLTSLGHPGRRAGLEVAAIGLMALAIHAAAPRFGLAGVIGSVLAVELLLLLALAATAARLLRHPLPVTEIRR